MKNYEIQDVQMILAGQFARHIVKSGDYTYICYSRSADAKLSDKTWQIQRIGDSGNIFAGGTRRFVHVASDPASLTYPSRS